MSDDAYNNAMSLVVVQLYSGMDQCGQAFTIDPIPKSVDDLKEQVIRRGNLALGLQSLLVYKPGTQYPKKGESPLVGEDVISKVRDDFVQEIKQQNGGNVETVVPGATSKNPWRVILAPVHVAPCAPFLQKLKRSLMNTPITIDLTTTMEPDSAGNDFFTVPHRDVSGLLDTLNSSSSTLPPHQESFYKRKAVKAIWKEMDELAPKKILFYQGQPGTGTSTAVWRKLLEMAHNNNNKGLNILWATLDQASGEPAAKVVLLRGPSLYLVEWSTAHVLEFVEQLLLTEPQHTMPFLPDWIAIDGMSSSSNSLQSRVKRWVRSEWAKNERRAIFTASTKVEKERGHQNDTYIYRDL